MKTILGPLLLAVTIAVISHLAILYNAPGFIMDRAMTMLATRGAELHHFNLSERTTPQTQSVVRPSPDLAYSVCLFDLDQAASGLVVKMAQSEGYSSLSFFDSSTNNFRTLRGEGREIEVRLLPPGSAPESPQAIVSPTSKGVMLIRRLAPTQAEYARVEEIAPGDACAAASE